MRATRLIGILMTVAGFGPDPRRLHVHAAHRHGACTPRYGAHSRTSHPCGALPLT